MRFEQRQTTNELLALHDVPYTPFSAGILGDYCGAVDEF